MPRCAGQRVEGQAGEMGVGEGCKVVQCRAGVDLLLLQGMAAAHLALPACLSTWVCPFACLTCLPACLPCRA